LQGHRPASAGSYSGHSPRLRGFNHRAHHGAAPGTNPGAHSPSRVSHRFCNVGHVARGLLLGAAAARFAFPGKTVFTPREVAQGFRGVERESAPLPAGVGRSQFGTVSHITHWQALAGRSWLSFSSPRFRGRRIGDPVRPVAGLETPHASRVERGQRPQEPPGRDYAASRCLTRFTR
jgi:hypothetical protein